MPLTQWVHIARHYVDVGLKMHWLVVASAALALVRADSTVQSGLSSQSSSPPKRDTPTSNLSVRFNSTEHVDDNVFGNARKDPAVPLLCNLTGHWRWSESTTLDILIEMTGTLTFNVTLYPLGIDWKTATGQCAPSESFLHFLAFLLNIFV